jgi:hypothetical protein
MNGTRGAAGVEHLCGAGVCLREAGWATAQVQP